MKKSSLFKILVKIIAVILFVLGIYLIFASHILFWGIITLVVGVSILFFGLIQVPGAELVKTGRKVMAEIQSLERGTAGNPANADTIIIHALGANGKFYQSRSIWYPSWDNKLYSDPNFKVWQQLQSLDIIKTKYSVPVYIDQKYPTIYYMDWANLQPKS